MRSLSVAAVIAVSLTAVPARAEAITLREVIDLTRAGLGEEVLLALIEIDQRVFPIDPATLRMLKEAGVTEKVIVAMVKSGRSALPQPELMSPPPLEPPEPQIVVVERERPVIREIAVPVPVLVAVPTYRSPTYLHDARDNYPRKPAEPVYWGWGGKLRPDAWNPAPPEKRREQKRER